VTAIGAERAARAAWRAAPRWLRAGGALNARRIWQTHCRAERIASESRLWLVRARHVRNSGANSNDRQSAAKALMLGRDRDGQEEVRGARRSTVESARGGRSSPELCERLPDTWWGNELFGHEHGR